ncbi:MAG: hypothetical protein KGL44_09980 [Sphingomonadales bacterium]|nr:hypothetical protein [Sphingomonadales bacterium]
MNRLTRWRAILAMIGLALIAPQPAQAGSGRVAAWYSSADATRKLERGADLPLARASGASADSIVVEPGRRFQKIVGFGAAMTDASAELFQSRLSRPQRDRLFADLFGRQGIALSFLRVPIGASDFSSRHYSFDDMPPGQRDPALAHYSMAQAEAGQLPALAAAKRINPRLTLMASPWSAPGWMKSSDSLIKGRLRPSDYPAFAAYLSRYLREMRQHGLPVGWLSIQNEPHFEPADYPGMRVDPRERAAFIGGYLGPMLARQRAGTRILDWDHNWDQPESPLAVLASPQAGRYVAGVAWHCYAGDVGAMEQVRAARPDKDVFFTECSGGDWAPDWGGTLGWMTDKLLIAASRAGSRGTLLWNLALDEQHGPHLGGCGNCRAVVTIDSRSGAVTRNVEYYVLGHASRFVRPGARRLASSDGGPVAQVAFRNPDGTLVLIAHNGGKAAATATVRSGRKAFRLTLPPGEVGTFVWHE